MAGYLPAAAAERAAQYAALGLSGRSPCASPPP